MLRLYKWIGILDNVITLLSSAMRKWKTRLEIWKDGNKESVDEFISCKVSSKVMAIRPLIFAYLKPQYVNYSKNPKSHKTLNNVKKMIVMTSNDTCVCYGVAKCT